MFVYRYGYTAPMERKNQMFVYRYGYTTPMERLVSDWDHDATNITLRWSGLFLVGSIVATNIPLRWSGGKTSAKCQVQSVKNEGF